MPRNDDSMTTEATPGHVASTDLFGGTAAEAMERSATLSACRTYRYALWRRWGRGDYAMFIGLNPSTADETNDDPTIRRCIRFARAWGYGALCMANLFAFRATQPADMKKTADPVGWENDHALQTLARGAGVVVAAWGAHRKRAVAHLLGNGRRRRRVEGVSAGHQVTDDKRRPGRPALPPGAKLVVVPVRLTAEEVAAVNELRAVAALNSARAERHALRQDAERWRAALSAYERGVVMSHDGRTGEKDGYVTLFLQALRERKADVA